MVKVLVVAALFRVRKVFAQMGGYKTKTLKSILTNYVSQGSIQCSFRH